MTACTCAEIRAQHRPPKPDDPNQTLSQVKCPTCCAASFTAAGAHNKPEDQ